MELAGFDWSEIDALTVQESDPTVAYEYFYSQFKAIFNRSFPEKTTKLSYRNTPRQPWMTKGLLKSCNKKTNLFKTYCQTQSIQSKNRYITYRNKFNSILHKAKQTYYKE